MPAPASTNKPNKKIVPLEKVDNAGAPANSTNTPNNFNKTIKLKPGEKQTINIDIPITATTSKTATVSTPKQSATQPHTDTAEKTDNVANKPTLSQPTTAESNKTSEQQPTTNNTDEKNRQSTTNETDRPPTSPPLTTPNPKANQPTEEPTKQSNSEQAPPNQTPKSPIQTPPDASSKENENPPTQNQEPDTKQPPTKKPTQSAPQPPNSTKQIPPPPPGKAPINTPGTPTATPQPKGAGGNPPQVKPGTAGNVATDLKKNQLSARPPVLKSAADVGMPKPTSPNKKSKRNLKKELAAAKRKYKSIAKERKKQEQEAKMRAAGQAAGQAAGRNPFIKAVVIIFGLIIKIIKTCAGEACAGFFVITILLYLIFSLPTFWLPLIGPLIALCFAAIFAVPFSSYLWPKVKPFIEEATKLSNVTSPKK